MRFIPAQHPENSNLTADEEAFQRFLNLGWAAQIKMNGYRLQAHVGGGELVAYTRDGIEHTRKLPKAITTSYLSLGTQSLNIFDSEWVSPLGQAFVFDILVHEGTLLNEMSYADRYAILADVFTPTDTMHLLPLITSAKAAMKVMQTDEPYVEGLVFKRLDRKGWPNTSIVRCRKPKVKK